MRVGKWLEISEKPNPGKVTKLWSVQHKDGDDLGLIGWYSHWRQYIFTPARQNPLLFSSGCLRDIAGFIEEHKEDRR